MHRVFPLRTAPSQITASRLCPSAGYHQVSTRLCCRGEGSLKPHRRSPAAPGKLLRPVLPAAGQLLCAPARPPDPPASLHRAPFPLRLNSFSAPRSSPSISPNVVLRPGTPALPRHYSAACQPLILRSSRAARSSRVSLLTSTHIPEKVAHFRPPFFCVFFVYQKSKRLGILWVPKAFSLSRSYCLQTSTIVTFDSVSPPFISIPENCIVSFPVKRRYTPLWLKKFRRRNPNEKPQAGSQPGSGGDHAHRHDGYPASAAGTTSPTG